MRSNISAVLSTGTLPWVTDRFGNPIGKPENLQNFDSRNPHPDAELADPKAHAATCLIPSNALTPGMRTREHTENVLHLTSTQHTSMHHGEHLKIFMERRNRVYAILLYRFLPSAHLCSCSALLFTRPSSFLTRLPTLQGLAISKQPM